MRKGAVTAWAGLIGLGVIVLMMPSGCTDQGGVHIWSRCTSFIGTTAPSFADLFGFNSDVNALIALGIGIAAFGIAFASIAAITKSPRVR